MIFFVPNLLELLEQRNHIELNLFADLSSHIYLPLDTLVVYILKSGIIEPPHPRSHYPIVLVLAIHHIVLDPPYHILGPRISKDELLSLSIYVNVPAEIRAENVRIGCALNQVRRKLSKASNKLPLDECWLLRFRCFLNLIQERPGILQSFEHHVPLVIEKKVLEFINIIEGKNERTVLFDSKGINNFNQSELIVNFLLVF
jgi:hypothetical protein